MSLPGGCGDFVVFLLLGNSLGHSVALSEGESRLQRGRHLSEHGTPLAVENGIKKVLSFSVTLAAGTVSNTNRTPLYPLQFNNAKLEIGTLAV